MTVAWRSCMILFPCAPLWPHPQHICLRRGRDVIQDNLPLSPRAVDAVSRYGLHSASWDDQVWWISLNEPAVMLIAWLMGCVLLVIQFSMMLSSTRYSSPSVVRSSHAG